MGFFPPFTYSSQKIYYLAHFKKWLPLWLEHIGHFPERSCWRSTQRNQRKVRRPKSTWLCKKRLGTNFLLFLQHFHNRRFSITRTTTTTLHGTASTLMYFQRQSDLCFTHNTVGIGVISEKKHFDMSLVARGTVKIAR